eukprot:CAMPEP_0202691912 /NCGR_PEP_ID=MMETSP1385-20130828/6470_1 /ASSEMBLY_ACC=CAM_ASM_000861 /TAXON_ID=933848 /ORGANISM="Elphidium margaritaceum" /LENGTH=2422 /DNA_ID=CAMNT_0049347375 /DNA_START=646 /DNA_END=7914 /DNA_ORIENTATION=-
MAEEIEKFKQYKYQSNANLVIQRLDSGIARESGPTGESSTLSTFEQSKLMQEMGKRAAYSRPHEEFESAKRKHLQQQQSEKDGTAEVGGGGGSGSGSNAVVDNHGNHKRRRIMMAEHHESVLDAEVVDTYRPTTTESVAAYELMIRFIEEKFGPQRTAVMQSIAHEIIGIIQDDKYTTSVSRIGQLNDTFGAFYTFLKNDLDDLHKYCRRINDFAVSNIDPDEKAQRENNRVVPIPEFDDEDDHKLNYVDHTNEGDEDDSSGDDRIEPNMEDPATKMREEQRQKAQNQKIQSFMDHPTRSSMTADDDQGEDTNNTTTTTANNNNNNNTANNTDDDGGGGGDGMDNSGDVDMSHHHRLVSDKKEVHPKDIDAYWLQRAIKQNFPDKADTVAKQTADEVLRILETANSTRELENRVAQVLGYGNWEFTKKMLRNKDVIVWCTKLKRAHDDEDRKRIETVMRKNGKLCGILEELQATYGTQEKKIMKFREERYHEVLSIREKEREQQPQHQHQHAQAQHAQAQSVNGTAAGGGGGGGDATTTVGASGSGVAAIAAAADDELRAWNAQHDKAKLDLDALAFREGGHFMSGTEWHLKKGSKYFNKAGYQEIFVPHTMATPTVQQHSLIAIESLPSWAQLAFTKSGDEDDDDDDDDDEDEEMKQKQTSAKKQFAIRELNAVQSQCYDVAFNSSENVLLSAPTGAGKTNVAMLTILREIGVHLNADQRSVRSDEFKIVYIAPMKSLVREVVLKFSARLQCYDGVRVAELSGDQQLSREQLAATTIIVTTPEKWDIVTRKGMDRSYTQLVKLMIIDEIHLLHDLRGSVLESIIARTMRTIEQTETLIRMVGLSATMPNYGDIADLLRVKYERGLFVFSSEYRPIPLVSRFAGITHKKPFKQYQLMNELCYEYVVEQAQQQQQCIIFVHSRKETGTTAKWLLQQLKSKEQLALVLPSDSADREILQQEVEDAAANEIGDETLLEILPFGFGVHHAGMSRDERSLVEDLFKARVLRVLVSTATLAWGVNLPAHCVIIKGTQIYNAQQSRWCELSMLDILQMFGRAGRPDTGDAFGEAYLITTHPQLKYYMPLLHDQLPIESQLVHRLPDCLNAEIVLGSVSSIKEAVDWLRYTFLYVRMRRAPHTYQVESGGSAHVTQRLIDLAHSALLKLHKCGVVHYDDKSGVVDSTPLGRIGSFFYVSHTSLEEYAQCLSASIINDIELFKILSLSSEFKYMSVRDGEKQELRVLLDQVPIPVKEASDSPQCKINVLLQAYISRLSLDGFALKCDMCYIQQSAQRLMRALFEICLHRKWAFVAFRCLTLCKMIAHQQWSIECPLRQFVRFSSSSSSSSRALTHSILNRIEKCQFGGCWDRLLQLSAAEIGELIRVPSMGTHIYALMHAIPRLQIKGQIQPLTPTTLKIELSIEADFEWHDAYHGVAQAFWLFVEDVDGESILHAEYFVLRKQLRAQSHVVAFTIPIYAPLPPQYFVRVTSDSWLGSTTLLPISFRHLILPTKYAPKTELLDLQPLPIGDDGGGDGESGDCARALYTLKPDIGHLNAIQTQVYHALYETNHNVLLCAPSGSGKTRVCAEIAILAMLREFPHAKCVYLTAHATLARQQYEQWSARFNARVCLLTGESTHHDVKRMQQSQIIVATPTHFDQVQRGWRKRKCVQHLNLLICDNLHFIGVSNSVVQGCVYEQVISRQKCIISALSIPTRIVALAYSLSNAKDVGDWLDVPLKCQFNFSPLIRPIRYQLKLKSSDINHFESRHVWYTQQCYSFVQAQQRQCSSTRSGIIIFVSSRTHCRRLASDLVALSCSQKQRKQSSASSFLNIDRSKFVTFLDKCPSINANGGLHKCLLHGVGFLHSHSDARTKSDVCKFYKSRAISILVVVHSLCFELERYALKSTANLTSSVILFGSKYYDAITHTYVDYELCDILQMQSFINSSSSSSNNNNNNNHNTAYILCHHNRESYLRKFLLDSYPIESHLDCDNHLEDLLNAEIAAETISNADEAIDFVTWTFYYFRLSQNPNYYNLRGVSDTDLSQHLSEVIEQTFHRLFNANCISVDEQMQVSTLNNGLICSFYYITYTTIEFFYSAIHKLVVSSSSSSSSSIQLSHILSILSYATEFEQHIAVRHNEQSTLRKLIKYLPHVISITGRQKEEEQEDWCSQVCTKVNVLLQTHFMRVPLKSKEIVRDQQVVLSYCVNLLYAMIDIMSTLQTLLNGVLITIELCQMLVQAMSETDSYLLQLPYMTKESAVVLRDKFGVKSIYDLLEMDEQQRLSALTHIGIAGDQQKLNDIALVCNAYPDLELNYKLSKNGDDNVVLFVTVEKESDDDDDDDNGDDDIDKSKIKTEVSVVNCPRYPMQKYESWFLIVGDEQHNKVVFIKRFTMKTLLQKFKIKLEEPRGKYKLYLMSDSYLGCDQFLDIDATSA